MIADGRRVDLNFGPANHRLYVIEMDTKVTEHKAFKKMNAMIADLESRTCVYVGLTSQEITERYAQHRSTTSQFARWPYPGGVRISLRRFNYSRCAPYVKAAQQSGKNYPTHSFISVCRRLGSLHKAIRKYENEVGRFRPSSLGVLVFGLHRMLSELPSR